ncbi:MAG: NUDIX domain-containing protein [Alphaproteobacteria bacterium]|nr:NUDIX domain-containing protein [Alphaproteobacteria bacterium]
MKAGKDYIGVGCGAFIVDSGRLLLGQRVKEPEAGFWSIPGGKVDFGETFELAACREILEETGLIIQIDRLLALTDHIVPDEGMHWVTPSFLAHVTGGVMQNLEPDKCTALEWFAFDALPDKLTIPTLKALAAYLGR